MKLAQSARTLGRALAMAGAGFKNAFFEANSRDYMGGVYDSASDTGTRSSTAGFPYNSKFQQKPLERKASVQKARSVFANLGLVKGLVENLGTYSIGETGLKPQPSTEDKEWNKMALDAFNAVALSPDFNLAGNSTFYNDQCLVLNEMVNDGELFCPKVIGAGGVEQSQHIKTEQVITVGTMAGDGLSWNDGILQDQYGKAKAYRVWQTPWPNQAYVGQIYTELQAADMVHVFWKKAVNQCHGMPWLHHGLNSCIDILDLLAFEKVAAKLNSALVAAITTATGQLPQSMERLVAANHRPPGAMPTQQPTPEKSAKAEAVRTLNFFGSQIPVLAGSEKIEFFKGIRPSLTFAGFIDYLVRDIAWGFGISPELVWNISGISGANTRFVVEQGERFFAKVAAVLTDAYCQRYYEWIISRAIILNKLPLPKDKGYRAWAACDWRGPRHMSVDRGRDGLLYIELVKNRMMTLVEWWTSQGEDPEKMRRQWIDELAEDLAYCEKKGVPPEVYLSLAPGQTFSQMSGQGGEGADLGKPAGTPAGRDMAARTAAHIIRMIRNEGLLDDLKKAA